MMEYNYTLQVWVKDGRIQRCAHPESMGHNCCNQRKYAGLLVEAVTKVHAMLEDN